MAHIPLPDHLLLFDGYCVICNGTVKFIIKRDKKSKFKFASLQSEFAKQIFTDFDIPQGQIDSVIYIQNGKVFYKSTAALKVAMELTWIWKSSVIFFAVPRFLRDFIYDMIAKYRYKIFGKKNSCSIPSEDDKLRFLE